MTEWLRFGEEIEPAGQYLFNIFYIEGVVLRKKVVFYPCMNESLYVYRGWIIADKKRSRNCAELDLCDPPYGH